LDVTVAGTNAGNRSAKQQEANNKKIDMEHETEIRLLSAETLATSIVLANLLSRFARIPALRLAIVSCFDQSVDMADDITAVLGKSAAPDHTVKVLRIVEEMRSMVLGNGEKPKSLV
jgi:hypothetical protein